LSLIINAINLSAVTSPKLFTELLKIFADNAGVDFIAFYEDLLRDKQASKIIERLGIEPKKIAA
jgi:hypothetical protein